MSLDDPSWLRKCSANEANEAVAARWGSTVTFDLRTWALHDAVFQLARESGLDAFRVECKQGPEGETVIALVLRGHGHERGYAPGRGREDARAVHAKATALAAATQTADVSLRSKKGD
jgi:hypothetical protein